MNYNQFKTEWKAAVAYDENSFDEDSFNDLYTDYKTDTTDLYNLTVLEWCNILYENCNMDNGDECMLKSKMPKLV